MNILKVNIIIHSFRKRLTDPDGISAKAAIDGLVKAELLPDDCNKYINEIRFKQTKIGTKEEEKTVITIEDAVDVA